MQTYQIPNYTRYDIHIGIGTRHIQIINKRNHRQVKIPSNTSTLIGLMNDADTRSKITLIRIIALAFHGKPPSGHFAHHFGGTYTPETVRFLPWREMTHVITFKKKKRILPLNTTRQYSIPSFSRYRILLPETEIVDVTHNQDPVLSTKLNLSEAITLLNDSNKPITSNVGEFVALAQPIFR